MSRYQPERRGRDPHPIMGGREIAFFVIVIGGFAVLVAAVAAAGLAGALFGEGFLLPRGGRGWGSAIGGIFTGDPAGGYPPAAARMLPSAAAIYLTIAICELVLLALAIAAVRSVRSNRAIEGMASKEEAAKALGRGELRKARSIIRPDLYPARGKDR